ncbi:hypothetical protein ACET3Z_003247 [Daucus carota]
MDSPNNLSRLTPLAHPTRTLLLKFNAKHINDQSETPTPPTDEDEINTNIEQHHNYYIPELEADDVPFYNSASSTNTPLRSPPHVGCLQTPSIRLYGSGSRRSRSVKSEVTESRFSRREEQQDDSQASGIYVTWSELWVTVPGKNGGRRPILQGLTGYVRPGECLAIMGPSGCGKSTLLDTLAGRLASNTTQSGDILINGRKQALAFGASAYVTQDNTLMTTLTVLEAIYFSAQLQLPDSMSKLAKRERAIMTITDMGLQDDMNTRIGGLTGGQKRRVSICIEILKHPQLLFLDEPTSGLDSAASYHVMSRIIKLAQQDKRTVIASIHQPSGEVFDLFHNLSLLSSGKQVYFGATSRANEFFASNGFPCPSTRNLSDHFLRTINIDFDVDVEHELGGSVITATKAIEILVNAYTSSEAHQKVINKVQEICEKNQVTLKEKEGQAGFITQCQVLTKRSFINMYRDPGYYWLRLVIYVALCLCIGTIFYDVGHSYSAIQAIGSMLMFTASFLTFMAIGGFPSFVEDMKIFIRERLNGHYGVAAYVVGNTLSSAPYLLLICIIPGSIAYFLVGLQKEFDRIVYFGMILFACMLLVESLMMMVASIVPDFLLGIITGAGLQGMMMLNGGFFRLPDDLPKPLWKYPISYISFHKYACEGLFKNEYLGLTFPNEKVGGPPTITGEEILKNYWEMEDYSKWLDLAVLLGMVVIYRLLFFGIIKALEKFKPVIAAWISSWRTDSEDNSTAPDVGCSVRRVRTFSLFDCSFYTVDLTFRE